MADAVVRGESAASLLGAPDRAGNGQGGVVQRYEAGEHAKTGDTHAELMKAYAPIQYTVLKDDTLESIADKFKISAAELKGANPDKIKKLPVKGDAKKTVDSFNPGDLIAVPQQLNEMARDAIHDKLNTHPGGIPVEYALGEKWPLSGDNTLNAQTLAVAQRAVAQSQ